MIAHIAPTLGVLVGLSAQRVFYPYYLTVPRLWGLSALDDQALGWGLMAVLNGLVYAITFLLLVAGLARHEERMIGQLEAIQPEEGQV